MLLFNPGDEMTDPHYFYELSYIFLHCFLNLHGTLTSLPPSDNMKQSTSRCQTNLQKNTPNSHFLSFLICIFLTNDHAHFTAAIFIITGNHSGYSIIHHGNHIHLKFLKYHIVQIELLICIQIFKMCLILINYKANLLHVF